MSIRISDAGDQLLITGPDEALVHAALQKMILRGAQPLGPPHPVGSSWVASCTKPGDFYKVPEPLALGDPPSPNQNVFQAVNLSDTGKHLIVTGKSKQAVQLALDALRQMGARNISSVAQVGNNWIATCEDPIGEKEQCTVDMFGPRTMVTGPSRDAVERKIADLTEISGKVINNIEQSTDGKWVAVIDNSGPKTW